MHQNNEHPWRIVPKQTWRRMLGLGHMLDLNKGGYYDARSAAINFWCGPDNKPPSWKDVEIPQLALNYPRAYVGCVSGLYVPPDYAMVRLTLYVDPYDRAEDQLSRKKWSMGKWDAIRAGHHPLDLRYGPEGHEAMKPLPDEWEWVEKHAQELLTMAERVIEPATKGIWCRLCDGTVSVTLFNEFLTHLRDIHRVQIHGVVVGGNGYTVMTNVGEITV